MITEPLTANDPGRGSPLLAEFELRQFSSGTTYECKALLVPEEDGGFSVFAMRLPGVISQGDTEEEALHNIAEAFRGAIQTYVELGQDIPWSDVDIERPKGSVERWIIVDA